MKKMRTKTIAIATTILTFLSASVVFANTTNNSSVPAPIFSQTQAGGANAKGDFNKKPNDSLRGHNDGFKTALDGLVTAGTITQEQKDAITAALSTATNEPGGIKTALDALVTEGTITQTQEDALTPNNSSQGHNDDFKISLDSLVTAGTITQAQEDAIQGSLD
ncbi:MAG: hypothetical protein P4L69_18915 [Desulfosporosinus sp.]|nr:hypothetical protein [Desulfosporosinus sp.]